jgi:hypothetical protein
VFDESLESMVSDELMISGVFIGEVVNVCWFLGRFEVGQPNGSFDPPYQPKYGTPEGTIFSIRDVYVSITGPAHGYAC